MPSFPRIQRRAAALAAAMTATALAIPMAAAQDLSVVEPIIVGAIIDPATTGAVGDQNEAPVPALPVIYSDALPAANTPQEDAARASESEPTADLSHTVEAD